MKINNIVIEKATVDDIETLIEFYEKLLPISQDIDISREIFNDIKDDEKYIILVAKDKSKVVGTLTGVACKSIAWNGYNFMVLDYLYVIEKYRKKGIATKLFNSMEDYAEKLNCGYIFFTSSSKNVDAHKLYEKLGYTSNVIGFRKVLIKDV